MSALVSIEYLQSLYNEPYGIPELDENGKIDASLLPASDGNVYLGEFTDVTALSTKYPTAAYGYYATVAGAVYYYNAAMASGTGAWTPEQIRVSDYLALSDAQKNGQPNWVIIPD